MLFRNMLVIVFIMCSQVATKFALVHGSIFSVATNMRFEFNIPFTLERAMGTRTNWISASTGPKMTIQTLSIQVALPTSSTGKRARFS